MNTYLEKEKRSHIYKEHERVKYFTHKTYLYDAPPIKLLDRLNYESKSDDNERKRNWGALPNS